MIRMLCSKARVREGLGSGPGKVRSQREWRSYLLDEDSNSVVRKILTSYGPVKAKSLKDCMIG